MSTKSDKPSTAVAKLTVGETGVANYISRDVQTAAIITDKKALNALYVRTIQTGYDYRDLQHQAVINALYHGMVTGDIRWLTRLYYSFTSNDRTALKLYVARINFERNGPTAEGEQPKPGIVAWDSKREGNEVPQGKAGGFAMVTAGENASEPEKAWIKDGRTFAADLIDKRLRFIGDAAGTWREDINGERQPVVPFFSRNNLADVLTYFTDSQAIKALQRVIEQATGAKEIPGKVNAVSDKLKKELTVVAERIGRFETQSNDAELIESKKRIAELEAIVASHHKMADDGKVIDHDATERPRAITAKDVKEQIDKHAATRKRTPRKGKQEPAAQAAA